MAKTRTAAATRANRSEPGALHDSSTPSIEMRPGVDTSLAPEGWVLNETHVGRKGYTEEAAERCPEDLMRRTEATSSGWPAARTAKQMANTDQLREAPQYIQKAGCGPG
jgi:hypothetical protein